MKIGFTSKYYEALRILKTFVTGITLFPRVYDEDRGTFSYAYYYRVYKNTINANIECETRLDMIKKYLSENLYSKKEVDLLISNLILYIDEDQKLTKEKFKRDLKNIEINKSIIEIVKFGKLIKKLLINLNENYDIIEGLSYSTIIALEKIKNNFDNIQIETVYNFFKTQLVEKKYMSEADLLKYLSSSFHKLKPPKKLFTLDNYRTKQDIIRIFYKYYDKVAGKPFKKQSKYADLLGLYFIGFDSKSISTNFSK